MKKALFIIAVIVVVASGIVAISQIDKLFPEIQEKTPACSDGFILGEDGKCVPEATEQPAPEPESSHKVRPVPDGDNPCEGLYCDTDEECCYGYFCILRGHTCARVCSKDRHCGTRCCDEAHGKCIDCPPPPKVEEKKTTATEKCPNGRDDECSPGFYCNPFKYCEKGQCDAERPCKEGFGCSPHGRCIPMEVRESTP